MGIFDRDNKEFKSDIEHGSVDVLGEGYLAGMFENPAITEVLKQRIKQHKVQKLRPAKCSPVLITRSIEGTAGQNLNLQIQPQFLFRPQLMHATDYPLDYPATDADFCAFYCDQKEKVEGVELPGLPETCTFEVVDSIVKSKILSDAQLEVLVDRFNIAVRQGDEAIADYGRTALHDVPLLISAIREAREASSRRRKVRMIPGPGTRTEIAGMFVGCQPVLKGNKGVSTLAYADWKNPGMPVCHPALFITIQILFREAARFYIMFYGQELS